MDHTYDIPGVKDRSAEPLPTEFTEKLYIVARADRYQPGGYKLSISTYDPRQFDNSIGYILMGETSATFQVPKVNPVNAEIEAIEKMQKDILAEAQMKVNKLNQRREELLAIEYKPEVPHD